MEQTTCSHSRDCIPANTLRALSVWSTTKTKEAKGYAEEAIPVRDILAGAVDAAEISTYGYSRSFVKRSALGERFWLGCVKDKYASYKNSRCCFKVKTNYIGDNLLQIEEIYMSHNEFCSPSSSEEPVKRLRGANGRYSVLHLFIT